MIRRYRLLKERRIDKVLRPIGYEFDIGEQTGDWMVEQGDAECITPRAPLVHGPHATPRRQQPALLRAQPKKWCCG